MPSTSLFKEKQVRRAWNTTDKKWVFSIDDIDQALTGSINLKDCIKKLRKRDPELDSYRGTNCLPVKMGASNGQKRLSAEGNETVTNCNSLKMTAADGKQRLTDVTEPGQLFRLIQSIPSHKAETFKRWLAKFGYERLEGIQNPALAAKRTRLLGNKWKPGARPPVSHSFRINILTHVSIRAHRVKGDIRISTAVTPSSPPVAFGCVDFPGRHRQQAFPQFPDFPQFRLHVCHSTPFSQACLLQRHQHLLVHTPAMLLRRLLQSIHQIFRNVPNGHRAHGWKLHECRQMQSF